MSYSEHVAKVVSDQLERFASLNHYQLAGHLPNLEFWIAEARHALEVIDGYHKRFQRLKAGQTAYISAHHTVTLAGDPDIGTPPDPPRRIVPDANLREARRAVVDATYRFLVRLLKASLVDESQLRSICRDLDISVDPADLRRKNA